MNRRTWLKSAASMLLIGATGVQARQAAAQAPIVIAHRGASGLRPEHTLSAYGLAIDQQADYIEADVVMTRDGVLVARHENEISGTTDVADHPAFADRWTTKWIDGQSVSGWFTEDFTLDELKRLRARERLPQLRPKSSRHDGQETVPTLEEIILFLKARETATGRRIGLYVETKHPSYFRQIGLPLEEALIALLSRSGYAGREDPLFLQSFEVGNLQRLRQMTELRLVQLIADEGSPADQPPPSTYKRMTTPAGLAAIAAYADAIGPTKSLIIPRDAQGRSLAATKLVADAHAVGLQVHPWTFRSENHFLPEELRRGGDPAAHGDAAAEYRQFLDLGVDGLFSDFPHHAVAARLG